MEHPRTHAIAVVTCSTRTPRLNPFLTQYVCSILNTKNPYTGVTLHTLDLVDQSLPLYDEPAVPSHLPSDNPTAHYTQEHTRKWSATVHQYDAFIFVTPQYNWSIPASLKNALDYLYHEWKGKPAAIVSYGGRGGGKAAQHLQNILNGLRIKVASSSPQLVVNSKTLEHCLITSEVSPQDKERWRSDGVEDLLQKAMVEILGELGVVPVNSSTLTE